MLNDLDEARRIRAERARTSYVERLAQVLLAVLAVAAFWFFARWVGPVLNPVLLSLLLAYLFDPLVDWLEARGVGRALGIVLLAFVGVAAVAIVTAVVVPVVAEQAGAALRELPGWASQRYDAVAAFLFTRFGVSLDDQVRGLADVDGLASRAQQAIATVVASFASSVTSLLNLVLIPIFTFYFLRDFDQLKVLPLGLVPPRYREQLVADARNMDRVVGDWLRGQVQVAMVLAVLYSVGLSVIGLRLGVLIGILAGLLNIVPYLGGIVGVSLAVLMALMYGSLQQVIGVAVVFVVVQLLEGYVITPRLVGEKVGMSPLTVMFVLLVGGSLFGFFGVLLSIPITAAGAVVARQWLARYRQSPFYLRATDDEPVAASAPGELAEESGAPQTKP